VKYLLILFFALPAFAVEDKIKIRYGDRVIVNIKAHKCDDFYYTCGEDGVVIERSSSACDNGYSYRVKFYAKNSKLFTRTFCAKDLLVIDRIAR